MLIRVFSNISLIMLLASQAHAQQVLKVEAGTSYTGDTYIGQEVADGIYIFDKIPEFENKINKILLRMGTGHNLFESYSGTVQSAAAVLSDRKKIIVYNQDFFDRLKAKCDSEYAVLGVLAHEIGHHIHDHNLRGNDIYLEELEADRFSGVYLQRFGANPDQAKCALRNFASEERTDEHPSRQSRLAALSSGFAFAKSGDQSDVSTPDPEPVSPNKLPTAATLPAKYVCKTNVKGLEVRIVGQHGNLLELHDTVTGNFYPAHAETLSEMGGATGYDRLSCDRVVSNTSMVAIVTGHNADLVQIYSVQRDGDELRLWQFRWLPFDSRIYVTPSSSKGISSFKILRGRNRDAYWQICWDGSSFTQSVSQNLFTRGYLECSGELKGYTEVQLAQPL